MVHSTIGRYETPSLHTSIEMLGRSIVIGYGLRSDPNGGAINQPSENPGLHDTEMGMIMVQLDQLVVAVCSRLQLQNLKDESKGMT